MNRNEILEQIMRLKHERNRIEEGKLSQKRIGNLLLVLLIVAIIASLIFVAFTFSCPCPHGGIEEDKNAIHKRVVDGSSDPIEGANVSLYYNGGLYDYENTSASGWANWTDLDDGLWTIKVYVDHDGDPESIDTNLLWDGEIWTLTNQISPEPCGLGDAGGGYR